MPFEIKDSGERQEFAGGMVRDTTTGKIGWHRVADGPMLQRWAEHLTKGATKYPDIAPGSPNWTLASGDAELARFRESAFRHFMSWYFGETDEDHAAATYFNLNGAEAVKAKQGK
jgi:dATP/dGTP diphosphohydrolase